MKNYYGVMLGDLNGFYLFFIVTLSVLENSKLQFLRFQNSFKL